MLAALSKQTFTLPDMAHVNSMEPMDQIILLRELLTVLKTLKTQFDELDGKQDQVQRQTLEEYMTNAASIVKQIYTSLENLGEDSIPNQTLSKAKETFRIDLD